MSGASTLRVLGEDEVRGLIDTDLALAIARGQLLDHAAGLGTLSSPAAMALDARAQGGTVFKFKAASIASPGVTGIRLIARANAHADATHVCAVFDHADNALIGLVSELWLSRLRTAAFAAVMVGHLASRGPARVALFGSGAIADELMPMLPRVLDIADIRVHARDPQRTAAFAARHEARLGIPMRAEASRERMFDYANVVITVTSSCAPLVLPGDLAPGALLCSLGNDNEVDFRVVAECDRLIVDDADFASEAGDGGAWIALGHFSRQSFAKRIDALAGEVLAETRPGRLHERERVLLLMQGMALGDVAFAAHALQEAERRGVGGTVAMPASGQSPSGGLARSKEFNSGESS